MTLVLLGFGKMGHCIKTVCEKRGHRVVLTIDPIAPDADVQAKTPQEAAEAAAKSGADGIIEFTHPGAVLGNIEALISLKMPLVVGTTGWNDAIPQVKKHIEAAQSWLLTSANFSIGVNMFYRIVSQAAQLMDCYDEYDCAVWEAHHNQKADSPSGTALEVARRILEKSSVKKSLVFDAFHQKPTPEELHVSSTRIGTVPGTHTVFFDSAADTIELTHTARSRDGFVMGAVRSLEWLVSGVQEKRLKSGLYSFDDVINSL